MPPLQAFAERLIYAPAFLTGNMAHVRLVLD
jgi:hypothetical protein